MLDDFSDRSQSQRPHAWNRLAHLAQLMRVGKPIGCLLLLWPTWSALWLAARGRPPWRIWIVFTLGVWLTRSAGCVINDYADRWLDPYVKRTQHRPLARAAVSSQAALTVFIGLMAVAFCLVLSLNRFTILLSLVALFLASTYPYLKRHTHFAQLYLGLAFSWGILMAFAAIQVTLPLSAWLLFVANICWTAAYDTWYAMIDRDDDLIMGAKSTAIFFGRFDLLAIAGFHVTMLVILTVLGIFEHLSLSYWLGLIAAGGIGLYWVNNGRQRTPQLYFQAFQANHWIGFCIFLGICLAHHS